MVENRKYDQCPKCGNQCYWRSGLGFDHEMRCCSCNFKFDPEELWEQERTERLTYNTHRD